MSVHYALITSVERASITLQYLNTIKRTGGPVRTHGSRRIAVRRYSPHRRTRHLLERRSPVYER